MHKAGLQGCDGAAVKFSTMLGMWWRDVCLTGCVIMWEEGKSGEARLMKHMCVLLLVCVSRYALVKEKRALTKFLKCVDWSDAQEAHQVRRTPHKYIHLVCLL